MKGILGLLRMSSRNNKPQQDHSDSVFFSTAFANQGVDPAMLVPWEARAVEVGAKRLPASKGGKLLQALWSKDKYMAHLDQDAVRRMENFFEFAQVPPNRDLIRQDEYGNFMIVLLSGTIAVDRLQPWGEQLRLAETRPGDILGEMSLAGQRHPLLGLHHVDRLRSRRAQRRRHGRDDGQGSRNWPPAWWRCWRASCRCGCVPSARG
jgi:CRP/FNR family cyclic AMP-dependent transcriptional regulator